MKITLLFLAAIVTTAQSQPRNIDPPAQHDSGMPFLTAGGDGAAYLAWTETKPDKESAIRFSKWNGTSWTPAETIVQGRNWFVNWADFGSLTVLPDRSMLAHWLTRADPASKFGYGIRIAKRDPNRPVWKQIHGVSLEEKVDYAGFLSFATANNAATYLAPPADGKSTAAASHDHDDHGHRKTVRFVEFRPDGSIATEKEIDADACSCCQTALGKIRTGWIAAYRDHSPGEIRDISIVRYADGTWTQPRTLHPDGWKINGCPTDGPSLVAKDSRVAIAWLTRANSVPKVQLAISSDDGKTFGQPVRIDSGNPLGRPSLTSYDDSSYLVTWLERLANGQVEVRVRRVAFDGVASQPITVSQAPLGRASGFPKAVVSGNQIILAWRDDRVRAVLLTKSQMKDMK